MITIKNSQRKIDIDVVCIESHVQKMLDVIGCGDFDLGIWFTTNKTIRQYNKKYREKDAPTDILSFPYHKDLKPGQKIIAREPDDKNLGDIIISLERARGDAQALGRPFHQHIDVLLAHGIAHLLGYDHKTDREYEQMRGIEKKLLNNAV